MAKTYKAVEVAAAGSLRVVLQNVRPMIETAPLERAAEAYARMMRGEARFR